MKGCPLGLVLKKLNSEVAYLSTLSLSIPIMHLPSLLEGPYG